MAVSICKFNDSLVFENDKSVTSIICFNAGPPRHTSSSLHEFEPVAVHHEHRVPKLARGEVINNS